MTTQSPSNLFIPLTHEQLMSLQKITIGFNRTQLIWLSGYFGGLAYQVQDAVTELSTISTEFPTITLISASQTGNARRLAEQLYNDLLEAKLKVNLFNAYDYKFKQINQEKLLIIVTSTQGEGEPPEEAVAMYKFLMSKKAPNCINTSFAVFGLGDASYQFFNQAAKDFDRRLADLGAKRLLERVDADVDYNETSNCWRQQLIKILKEIVLSNTCVQPALNIADNINKIYDNQYTREAPLTASILVNQKITGRYSDKDVRHIEIDLGNSILCYQPGDALGVWYENDLELVKEILHLLHLKGDELIKVNDKNLSLCNALQKHFELTVNTPNIVKQYAALSRSKELLTLVNDKAKLHHYVKCLPLVDMIRHIPVSLSAEQLINLVKPLTPRLYSIASSQTENKTEVHITVGVVRYKINGHMRGGGASTWLADRIEENSEIRIFVEHNKNFRLPENTDASIIMIGAGTGIAPFRAFMQQRYNNSAKGKNWLFFGNPHFTEDFLYQVEWQKYFRDGLLTNIDLAWSRDQAKKIYVQDKIRTKSKELWSWIEDGAYIYVCGDANRMAKDVEQALLDVVTEHGGMNSENADEFLSDLRIKRRYQRDIY